MYIFLTFIITLVVILLVVSPIIAIAVLGVNYTSNLKGYITSDLTGTKSGYTSRNLTSNLMGHSPRKKQVSWRDPLESIQYI
jgi:hypothetical protein